MVVGFILILLASFAISWWYYRGQDKSTLEGISKTMFVFLFLLRTLGLFLCGLLLLGYVFRSQVDEKQEPVVLWLQDDSQSILFNKDSSFFKNTLPEETTTIQDLIEEQFQLEKFSFGEQVTEGNSFHYEDQLTDIQKAMDEMYSRFYGRNIGAVIMASDGIYNKGASPLYGSSLVEMVPLYTIGLGDTTQQRDIFINEVHYNELAFLGNDFIIQGHVQGHLLEGESYTITLQHDGQMLESESFKIDSNYHENTISWKVSADEIGVQRYDISIAEIDNEITYENNKKSIFIEVVDSRQKILLLASSPHPDVGAVKAALIDNKNYEVDVQFMGQDPSFNDEYSLIFLFNLPSKNFSELPGELKQSSTPKIYVAGGATDLSALTNTESSFKLSGRSSGVELVQAKINSSFSKFKIPGQWKKNIENYPPLFTPYAQYDFYGDVDVLAYQAVAGIQKENPLVVVTSLNGVKTSYIMGEGIWRWRINEGKKQEQSTVFDGIIQKLVQVTARKEDLSRLRIQVDEEWNEQESIVFYGEFYNDAFELINSPELELELQQQGTDKVYNYSFLKAGEGYQLDIGAMPPGSYSWKAALRYQNQSYTKAGVIRVSKIDREGLVTKANHQLLRDIAQKSGGAYLHYSNMDDLPPMLQTHSDIQTITYQSEDITDLIDWKLILFVIVGLFAMEWFLRKYHGAL